MRGNAAAFVLILALSLCSAQAQVSIDVSKVTCDQFVHGKVGATRTVAAWLSGFYNGRQNNQVVDTQAFETSLSKLEQFCYQEKNFNMPVLQAIESIRKSH
jgi:acid stress chaperone HdeB